MYLKDKILTVQSVVSIIAIIIGGWWTYENFIQERKNFPHANIDFNFSQTLLTPEIRLLGVSILISNTGTSRMEVQNSEIRIQQILPLSLCPKTQAKCAVNDVEYAIKNVEMKTDRFAWPMIAYRKNTFKTPRILEPGEKEQLDYEFAIPAAVRTVRIYSHVLNKKGNMKLNEGWHTSTFYDFSNPM